MRDAPHSPATATLRLLQTTDLHMQLLPFDYVNDCPTGGASLHGLEQPILEARAAGLPCVLMDGGDFLQGSPLADALAEDPETVHPMIMAFNRLDYDVLALGNHEFEYGLPFLTRVLSQARAAAVSANLRTGPIDHYVAPWTIVSRSMTLSDGRTRDLKIGILGLTPPQVTDWSAAQLSGALTSEDAISAVFTQLPKLRRAGADIVVALCHGGPTGGTENPAAALARLRGIDAVLMGHLHEEFPGPAFDGLDGADARSGTLHDTPAMMPGSHGSHLGQMDLDLTVDPDGHWTVTGHRIVLLPPHPTSEAAVPDPHATGGGVTGLAAAHDRARAHLAQVVCDSPVRATTYFAAIGHDPTADLLAHAQTGAIRAALAGSQYADLPVLCATAPFSAGGHGGARNYIDIAPGPVRRRDCHALAPFDNPVCAVLRHGWQIRQWLENSSAAFARTEPDTTDGALLTGAVPPYHFDTIHGLTYQIDLTRDPCGATLDRPGRIRDLRLNGAPVEDDMTFVVAASSYRVHGGGGLVLVPPGDIIHETDSGLRALLTRALSEGTVVPRIPSPVWRFTRVPDTAVTFASAAAARALMPAGVTLLDVGRAEGSFATFSLDLSV